MKLINTIIIILLITSIFCEKSKNSEEINTTRVLAKKITKLKKLKVKAKANRNL